MNPTYSVAQPQTIAELADYLLKNFRAGLDGLAKGAGWTPGDYVGVVFEAATQALNGFDQRRGDLIPRACFFCERQAQKSRLGKTVDVGLDDVPDAVVFDDPAEILAAKQAILSLPDAILAAALSPEKSKNQRREARRLRAQMAGALEKF